MGKRRDKKIHKTVPKQSQGSVLRIIPLGGVGDMGKNMIAVEYGNDIVVIECGLMFPDETMLGIDKIIPDVTYLEQNKKKLRGFVITHGHEDHIGAIPYVVPKLGVPVFAPKLAAALIKVNLEEFPKAKGVRINTYKPNDKIRLGKFTVSFFRVNHSIPDSFGVIIDTPEGKILHTGDFKFDPTPPDGIEADYEKLKKIGQGRPLLLMSESTNVHTPGRTPSEQVIADIFMDIFANTKGRLIISSFASRIDRIQHAVAAAVKYKRKIAIAGRSMIKYFDAARKLGYVKYPKDILIRLNQIKNYDDNQIAIICTGSQGQEGSALQRMAFGEHRQVKIKKGDTVVVSSSPIPGNENSVTAVINNLYRAGADVIFDKIMQIHVTGHCYRDEMKMMLEMVKPRFFIPVHGDYHMLVAHSKLAKETGVNPNNIFVIEDGDVIEFKNGKAQRAKKRVQVGSVLVDGLGVGDVKGIVLRDRKTMGAEGVMMVVVMVNKKGKLVGSPDIISRGFVYMRDNTKMINKTREHIKRVFEKHTSQKLPDDWTNIKIKLRESIGEYLFKETERRPLVLPVVIEV